MNYIAWIRYIGTDFCGFQFQPNARTVQGTLTEASAAVFGCPCHVTGCSRTDSGVHAMEFCALIEPDAPDAPIIPPAKLPLAYAAVLPPDLAVLSAATAPAGFHPRYSAVGKEYRYRIDRSPVPDPFLVHRSWHRGGALPAVYLARMQDTASVLIGRQDFCACMASGSTVTDTVRTVHFLTVSEEGNSLWIDICADGFLYNMVRIIVGTLWETALGRCTPDDIRQALKKKDRALLGQTAPPDGLYLWRVFYDRSFA